MSGFSRIQDRRGFERFIFVCWKKTKNKTKPKTKQKQKENKQKETKLFLQMELQEILEEDMGKFIIKKPTFSLLQSFFCVCFVSFGLSFVCSPWGAVAVGVVIALIIETKKTKEG